MDRFNLRNYIYILDIIKLLLFGFIVSKTKVSCIKYVDFFYLLSQTSSACTVSHIQGKIGYHQTGYCWIFGYNNYS